MVADGVAADAERSEASEQHAGVVCKSLAAFVGHPDSHVSVSVARSLWKVVEFYPDSLGCTLSNVRRAHEELVRLSKESILDADSKEAFRLYEKILSRIEGWEVARTIEEEDEPIKRKPKERTGQVVLKTPIQKEDQELRDSLLTKVVSLPDVQSSTFEGDFIIVITQSLAVADDAMFLADLLNVIKEQGVHGVSLVGSMIPHLGASALPSSAIGGSSATSSTAMPTELEKDEDEDKADDEQPAGYLDDMPCEGQGLSEQPPTQGQGEKAVPHWSFFSQQSWIDARRMQEWEDDPTIAARLAKKKMEMQKKREEDERRFSRWTSWLVGWQKTIEDA